MQSFLHRSTQRRRRRTHGRCEEEGGRAIPLPPMYPRSSMRGGEPFSPSGTHNHQTLNQTQQDASNPPELWTPQWQLTCTSKFREKRPKLNSKCVPANDNPISKAKPCDADLHTCASTPMRCGQPTTILRLGLPLHAASKDLADDTHVSRECLHP